MARLISLLVADAVREEKSGKLILLGIYGDVKLDEAPEQGELFVYVSFEDVPAGDHSLDVTIIDRTAKRAAVGPAIAFKATDEAETFVHILQIPDFQFPSSGVYTVVAKLDGERLGKSDFKVSFPLDEFTED